MPHSNNSPERASTAERRTRALELRKEGKTFAEIGRAMGFTEQRAHRVVTEELQRLNADRAEQAAEVTRLELERLDGLWAGVWESAKGGDGPAIDRALAIMARRARLLGLDKAEKRELTGAGGGALRFALEEAVAADRELDEWEGGRDRVQPEGGEPLPTRGPQVPA
jgi:hypothetical protein